MGIYDNWCLDGASWVCDRTKNMKKYDWKKTAIKAAFVLGEVLVAGTLAYIVDNPSLLVVAPILEIALDWFKHHDKKN